MNAGFKDLKISISAPPTKSKIITFRVTDNLHDTLSSVLGKNEITMSQLMVFIIEEYFKIRDASLEKARYFRSLEKEKQEQILTRERDLPPRFRQFTLALKDHPSAEAFSKAEMDDIWDILPKDD